MSNRRWPEQVRFSQLYADPLRFRVLAECNARELSPRAFYEQVGGGTQAKVSQAFELLAQYDWLEPTRLEGGDQFYRGTGIPVVPDEVFEELSDSTQALVVARIIDSLIARTREAMKTGTISAQSDTHLTWMPLELDRQGWKALVEYLDEIFAWLPAEQRRARARMEETGEEPIPVTAALLAFESPKDPERKFT